MAEKAPKNYPVASDEVAKMLGLFSDLHAVSHAHSEPVSAGQLPVKNLPIVESMPKASKHAEAHPASHASGNMEAKIKAAHASDSHGQETPSMTVIWDKPMFKVLKSVTPYLVVFTLGVFLYFFFFSKTSIDFSKIFSSRPKAVTPQQSAIQQLESNSANMTAYRAWISGFYYDVSDAKVLDPNTDNSGNGLSNFQKFLLNLNPKSYDTLGLGVADSEALANGINPLSGTKLTDSQKAIIDKYFDMEAVMNRLALNHLQNKGQVAGMNVGVSNNNASQPGTNAGNSNNSANSGQYRSFPVNGNAASSNNQAQNQAQNSAQSPAARPAVVNDGANVETGTPGRLEIPSLKVNAPIIWTSDSKNFETDLKSGVVHYPGTAMPGQIGTTYISGHSSNYAWVKGNYNHVFTQLGDLANDASFKVTVKQKNGKDAVYHYVVVGRQQYDAKDQAQFKNGGQSVVALSTCWPVGTTSKRLVVYGQLTQVEYQ